MALISIECIGFGFKHNRCSDFLSEYKSALRRRIYLFFFPTKYGWGKKNKYKQDKTRDKDSDRVSTHTHTVKQHKKRFEIQDLFASNVWNSKQRGINAAEHMHLSKTSKKYVFRLGISCTFRSWYITLSIKEGKNKNGLVFPMHKYAFDV